MDLTEFDCVLAIFMERYRILLDLISFHLVLLGFTGFYWVSMGFNGFQWVDWDGLGGVGVIVSRSRRPVCPV